jgi:phytoene dehydrogenase-like protein
VALESGEEIYARAVVSACDPKVTFLKLVEEKELPGDFVRAVRNFKFRGSSGKVNLALDGLPHFTAMPDKALLHGMIEISGAARQARHEHLRPVRPLSPQRRLE